MDAANAREEPPTGWNRLRDFVRRNGRRLSMVALAIFLAAIGVEVGSVYPREVHVAVPLSRPEEVTEVRIEYQQDGQTVKTIRMPVERGTRELRDTVDLSPGDYDVSVMLFERSGRTRELDGRLTAPADGVVRLALESR